ncbi:hypothetical protein D046_9380, partial [Vibrio parahaemolyticus V-223/04]
MLICLRGEFTPLWLVITRVIETLIAEPTDA